MKDRIKDKLCTNSKVYKRLRRTAIADLKGGCDMCPPHSGENIGKRSKRGPKKPKYKQKRK